MGSSSNSTVEFAADAKAPVTVGSNPTSSAPFNCSALRRFTQQNYNTSYNKLFLLMLYIIDKAVMERATSPRDWCVKGAVEGTWNWGEKPFPHTGFAASPGDLERASEWHQRGTAATLA